MDEYTIPLPGPVAPAPPAPAPAPPAQEVIVLGGHSLSAQQIAAKYAGNPTLQNALLARQAEAQTAAPALTKEARRVAARAQAGQPAIRITDADGLDIALGDCGCEGSN